MSKVGLWLGLFVLLTVQAPSTPIKPGLLARCYTIIYCLSGLVTLYALYIYYRVDPLQHYFWCLREYENLSWTCNVLLYIFKI